MAETYLRAFFGSSVWARNYETNSFFFLYGVQRSFYFFRAILAKRESVGIGKKILKFFIGIGINVPFKLTMTHYYICFFHNQDYIPYFFKYKAKTTLSESKMSLRVLFDEPPRRSKN